MIAGRQLLPLRWSVGTSQITDDQGRQQIDAVMRASRVLVSVVARSLAEVEDIVTLPQFRVLVMIAGDGPQNLGSVAAALGVHPSNATRLCERLVVAGLVDRGDDPQDPPVPAAGPDRRGAPPRREGDAAPAYGDRDGDGPDGTVAATYGGGRAGGVRDRGRRGPPDRGVLPSRAGGLTRWRPLAPPDARRLLVRRLRPRCLGTLSPCPRWRVRPRRGSPALVRGPRWDRPGPGHARRATR